MALFATFKDLRDIGKGLNESRLRSFAASHEGKTIFLSHSSKDHEFLPAIIQILENHGGDVYIDDRDDTVSGSDYTRVASRLRTAIRGCRRLVLFVTPNTKESKWIPWELGLGDGIQRDHNVALFPASEYASEQSWSETEYLGLYQRIVWGRFDQGDWQWLVLNHRDNTAVGLRTWLTR